MKAGSEIAYNIAKTVLEYPKGVCKKCIDTILKLASEKMEEKTGSGEPTRKNLKT